MPCRLTRVRVRQTKEWSILVHDVQNFTIGARYNYGLQQIGKGNASVAGQATRNSKNSVIALFVGIGF